jgi:predicted phosphohydrolase
MKKILVIIVTVFSLLVTSCVQKTYKRTVVYTLDVSNLKNVEKVGVRGWDNPLSWNNDFPMKKTTKPHIYQVAVTSITGRICTQYKFAVNDEIEEGENRKIYFDNTKDTTYVLVRLGK